MSTLTFSEEYVDGLIKDGEEAIAERDAKIAELEAQRDQLAAENAGMNAAFKPEVIPEEAVNAFMDTAILDHDWNDTGEWSWVENETDVIRAVLDALVKPETPTTDAWQREQMARGVETAAATYHPQVVTGGSDDPEENGLCIREDLLSIARKLRAGEAV